MEKEILFLKEEVLALRQQVESLNKKLETLNLNLIQKELSGVENNGRVIVKPIIIEPMEHPYAKKIIELGLAQEVKTFKSAERYGHTTIRKFKPNSRFKK